MILFPKKKQCKIGLTTNKKKSSNKELSVYAGAQHYKSPFDNKLITVIPQYPINHRVLRKLDLLHDNVHDGVYE